MIRMAFIHAAPPVAVERLVARLSATFATAVVPAALSIDPAIAFDPRRRQYNSTTLLAELLKHVPAVGVRIVAVTDLDLFIPVLTFVFGEAQFDGRAAIVSTHRLRNSFYGLADDPKLLLSRLDKEVVHELGHTFGLVHCRDYRCAMHASTSVEGVDLKGAELCRECRARLGALASDKMKYSSGP